MTPVEKRALIDRYLEAYNAFDIDGMMATVHPDVEFQNVANGEVNATALGATAFRQLAEQAIVLFTARRQSVTAFEVTNDGAAVDIEYEGVLATDLPNGLKAGDTLRLQGHSTFVICDGKLRRIIDYS